MGLTTQGLEFLVAAKRQGTSFERTITIGRQFLNVSRDRLESLLVDGGGADSAAARQLLEDPPAFAEPLLRCLGAQEVDSIDGSDFEGATFVHDLNAPLPPSFEGRYTAVVDGGCLEHVFDFATAIRSCMQMVAVGGHLLSMPPVNNAAGHGFYQFSPELYFRLFSPDNGFVVEQMLLAEVRPGSMWYRVVDPAVAGRRVEFATRNQAYLYVQARRVDDRSPLATPPVQSDYDQLWRSHEQEPGPTVPSVGAARRQPALKALRVTIRRQPAIARPLRRAMEVPARFRRWRQPLDPRHFQPLGRELR